ncbi:MAG: adenylate cyclase, partial [Spirochaetaceae bacterium]|nr:adenylate cyclase [Spirochaetaceae bacterium]
MASFLVFFKQAGFSMVEAGFIRAKNATNIPTKNFLGFCMASMGFFLAGYDIMFGKGGGFMGLSGFFMRGAENPSGVPTLAFWLFHPAFCGAAAAIVAGGMAERIKFPAYLIYSLLVSALVYPIVGHWIWGGGWLAGLGFAD